MDTIINTLANCVLAVVRMDRVLKAFAQCPHGVLIAPTFEGAYVTEYLGVNEEGRHQFNAEDYEPAGYYNGQMVTEKTRIQFPDGQIYTRDEFMAKVLQEIMDIQAAMEAAEDAEDLTEDIDCSPCSGYEHEVGNLF